MTDSNVLTRSPGSQPINYRVAEARQVPAHALKIAPPQGGSASPRSRPNSPPEGEATQPPGPYPAPFAGLGGSHHGIAWLKKPVPNRKDGASPNPDKKRCSLG